MIVNKGSLWTRISLVLAFSLLMTPAAFAAGRSLTGSWQSVATFDGSGDQVPFLATFNIDRTWISSGALAATSVAHGAWKRTGGRTFSTRSVVFFYDEDGNLALTGESTSEIQLSHDGQSYTGVFQSTITALDGTVVATNTGTETGERIRVNP